MAQDTLSSIEDLTPTLIREKYLTGLQFVDCNKQPYPDDWYAHHINVAIAKFEEYTNLSVNPKVILSERHDYFINDYQQYAFLQLYNYPVIPVTTPTATPVVRAVYPTGQVVTTFPAEWVRLDRKKGTIQLVPTQGTLSQVILGQGGSYLPIIYQGMGYLPQLFEVDYTAGFAKGEVPINVLDAMAKLSSIEMLSVVGDTVVPPGITSQSIGIDGMSQSKGFMNTPQFAPAFSGRISQYKRDLFGDPSLGVRGVLDQIKQYYRGINLWTMA